MKFIFIILIAFHAMTAFAIECDCDVNIYSPMTGPHTLPPDTIKTYTLEEYSSYKVKNQVECRNTCLKEFEKDMPPERLTAMLITYGQSLITQKVVGYNCTGLTTLKFPVRVKARLGNMSLGNVADLIQVVTHEEICFNY